MKANMEMHQNDYFDTELTFQTVSEGRRILRTGTYWIEIKAAITPVFFVTCILSTMNKLILYNYVMCMPLHSLSAGIGWSTYTCVCLHGFHVFFFFLHENERLGIIAPHDTRVITSTVDTLAGYRTSIITLVPQFQAWLFNFKPQPWNWVLNIYVCVHAWFNRSISTVEELCW